MKKLFISTLLLAGSTSYLNANQGVEIADGWKTQGDVRLGYVHYEFKNPPTPTSTGRKDSRGIYLAPKVSILTPKYKNFSVKATVAGVTDFGINDPAYETRNFAFDGTENKSFAIAQELFLSYSDQSHSFTIGRQELVTPLVEADDYYILANSYDAINYTNSSVNNFSFHLGYFYQMSGVWDSGANGTEFHSMSDSSFVAKEDKENADDTGIMYGAVEYKDENHKLKLWEYYISDLYNIFLADYKFSNKTQTLTYNASLQFVNYKEVGELASHDFTNIDYSIFSAKLDTSLENGIYADIAATKYTDGEGQGVTLGAWGGFPSYTYGFTHSYFIMGSLRDANIYKFQIGYDLQKVGLDNFRIEYRCNYYALNPNYSKSATDEAQELMRINGIKISYADNNGIYFNGMYEYRRLDKEENGFALRLIGGYRF